MVWVQKYKGVIVEGISYLFILLFVYAAVSKLLDFENFEIQIGQSPLLTAYAHLLVYAVPAVEIVIAAMLVIPRLQLSGFYAAFTLMVMFTTYIVIILNLTGYIPCSCGGVLEKMGWTEHLILNLFFVGLAYLGIMLNTLKKSKKIDNILLQ